MGLRTLRLFLLVKPKPDINNGVQGTYYTDVRVENKIDRPIILTYTDGEKTNERIIPASSVQTASFITTSLTQPDALIFTAVSENKTSSLLINGKPEFRIFPNLTKFMTVLEVTDPNQNIFYINLEVNNNAGKKVTLVWSEDDSPQTRDIEDGQTVNLTKTIHSSANDLNEYEFKVHEFDTNNNLLINGAEAFTIKASNDPATRTYIRITSSGKDFSEQFSWKFLSFFV